MSVRDVSPLSPVWPVIRPRPGHEADQRPRRPHPERDQRPGANEDEDERSHQGPPRVDDYV